MDCKLETPDECEFDKDGSENKISSCNSPAPSIATIATEYHDYVEEMNNFVMAHVQVSNSNAIELNEKMRKMLIILRANLEELRAKCVARYETNAEELKRSKKLILLRGRFASYSTCGQPYFKNRKFYKSPPNCDYLERKTRLRELFPLDLDYTFGHWTIHDKTTLIFGVKEQLINYLETCNIESRNLLRNNRLADLYKIGGAFIPSFRINWNKLVLQNLKERHTASETISMWNEYLHPHIRRGPWTSVEDTRLLHAAKKFNFQNWSEIAKMVPNRSKLQCMVHCHCVLFDRLRHKAYTRWTKEEDELLLSLVRKYSLGKYIPWTKVTEQLPYRTKIQVYHRYVYSLNPDINRSRFTPEEDCVLLAAIQQYGKFYADIPTDILPGRTPSQIRQRYNNVLKYSGKINFWTVDDDKKLMALVEKHGTSNWAEISRELSNHTRISCRTRHSVITQFLDKNPKSTIDDVPRKRRKKFSKISEDNWLETLINLKNGTDLESKAVVKHIPDFYKKLSTIHRLYYDFFKYSYNFKYDANPYCNFPMEFIHKNVLLYAKFLDFNITTSHINIEQIGLNPFEIVATNYVGQSLNKFINVLFIDNLTLIPPLSWNSMLLYRNLSTFVHNSEEMIDENTKETKASKATDHPALKIFKERLAMLLYYPYLLSKCNISNFVGNQSRSNEPRIEGYVTIDPANPASSFVIEYTSESEELSSKRFRKNEGAIPKSKKKVKTKN